MQDEEAGIYTPQQMPAALVADIATDPNGTVRQVGTGVGTIYVLVEVDAASAWPAARCLILPV